MDKQYEFDITFYLSNGENVQGSITVTQKKEDYLQVLEDWVYKEKFIKLTQLGFIIQSKYITHISVEEVK
ncbi:MULTISPECIES: hypothetical protein [Bacillus]|uniref:hypothetical protein n=1 Tax=Bacillus TaxID=1386 RepID=UPI00062D84BE|nr:MULTISPECIES: hypothetical protein [Bacillus]MDK7449243.1 hypothetical protein [Bacillus paranthracis]OXL91319.1 hypothetical protein B6N65_28690 [Bacillus sp. KbaB1]